MLIKGCPPYLYCTIHSFLSIFLVKIRLGTPGYGWEDLLTPRNLKYGWVRLKSTAGIFDDFWRFFFKKVRMDTPTTAGNFLVPA